MSEVPLYGKNATARITDVCTASGHPESMAISPVAATVQLHGRR